MAEYDEKTCVTAGDLRARGVPVPSNVPDCGWIPRSAINYQTSSDGAVISGETMTFSIVVTFNEPFRWIELDVVVTKQAGAGHG